MKKIIKFRGLNIKIENPAGSIRSGIAYKTGKPWSIKMSHDYGEILGTVGMDGDPVDVFLGPNKNAQFVFVVHQLNKYVGDFDEDKCFLGFDDVMDAKAAYYKNFDYPDHFYGNIETIPFKKFVEKLKTKDGMMIHASTTSLDKGDPVTVDGMRGRGVIVAVKGDDVVVKYRSGIYIKRNKMYVHNMGDNMYKSRYVSAAQVITSPELNVVTRPQGPLKAIKKVGTNFCVVSEGTDKNFGCYGSKEQAQAVISGGSFIEPNMPKNLLAKSNSGKKKLSKHAYVSRSRDKLTMTVNQNTGELLPPDIKAFNDLGEPMAGALAHAHMEPELWFHPPSESRPTRVPVDEPNEKNDRFLDVTKRKQAKKDRMDRLKRAVPGGLPPLIPAHTTLVAPHTATYMPGMGFSAIKAGRTKDRRARVSYDRQGCI